MTLTNVSFAIKAGGAAIAALWLGLAPVVQILLVLMALDIATGLFAAYVRHGLDSAIELLIAATAQWVAPIVGGLPPGIAVAGFHATHELRRELAIAA
jgi:hypothetical protein